MNAKKTLSLCTFRNPPYHPYMVNPALVSGHFCLPTQPSYALLVRSIHPYRTVALAKGKQRVYQKHTQTVPLTVVDIRQTIFREKSAQRTTYRDHTETIQRPYKALQTAPSDVRLNQSRDRRTSLLFVHIPPTRSLLTLINFSPCSPCPALPPHLPLLPFSSPSSAHLFFWVGNRRFPRLAFLPYRGADQTLPYRNNLRCLIFAVGYAMTTEGGQTELSGCLSASPGPNSSAKTEHQIT